MKEEKIKQNLQTWYKKNKRDLPWRQNTNPYNVWISEIMLQQTRVEAVIPYFQRFLTELPNISSLATVKEDRLLKLWEGLGYYSRAKNLKKCAQVIEENYHGKMPETFEELKKLPGIGFYTAGAIASISFHEPVGAIDGNVLRIFSRLYLDFDDITKEKTKRKYFEKIKSFIPSENPGEFNQALMDLGATICIPNGKAKCEQCPIAKECLAYQQGKVDMLPQKSPKKERTVEEKTIFLYTYQDEIAIKKRPKTGLLASLYEYPNQKGFWTEKDIQEDAKKKKLPIKNILYVKESSHIFSHIKWNMIGYEIPVKEKIEGFLWVKKEELFSKYSIPTAFKTYTEYLKNK